jgi:hypothetical protein
MMRARPHTARARLGAQEGIAMVAALAVLMVVSLLLAAAVTVGVQTVASARTDANNKSALEAAEAGLQVASYRMNMLAPDAAHCVGDAVASPDSTGTCASSTYTLGNGASYRYWTTPAMGASGTCVGLTLTPAPYIAQRCITAQGTANGVVARSQTRMVAFVAAPLFPIPGVTGLTSVSLSGNAVVTGTSASNASVTAVGNATSSSAVIGPGGSTSATGNASLGTKTQLTSPIVLDPVNPGTSNQSSLTNCPARAAAGYTSCNDDYRITNGLASPTVSPYDQSSGNVSFDPATRTLSLSANSSLTLGGGLYNFCQINAAGNSAINLGTGVRAEIFIDSPDDPGSGCASGTGSLNASGNMTWTNPLGDPTALQIYIYGFNNGSNAASFSGNATFTGIIYAPQSTVKLSGNAAFYGAISGNKVSLVGNNFNWVPSAGTLQATTNGLYYRSAWAQCTPTAPTPSAPGSGCG